MSKKFGKNRSVDENYMTVPIKYCTNVNSSRQNVYSDTDIEEICTSRIIKELKKRNFPEDMCNEYLIELNEYICPEDRKEEYKEICKKAKDSIHRIKINKRYDKEFVIIDFYGKNALCAWRNITECKIGMTFLCPIIHKNKKTYLKYKNQYISLNTKTGWVY